MDNSIEKRIEILYGILKHCKLCPKKCLVDRIKGERGFCELPDDLVIDCAVPHYGEEPPLSGRNGAGTIFFSSCNLRCIYCQNYQISQKVSGNHYSVDDLAVLMLILQEKGCHNIEPVTPTPQSPHIMKALSMAKHKGLKIPFVYNCGGYENPEIIKLFDGLVDIYLPDFKYGGPEDSLAFSGVKDYARYAIASIGEMIRQVGSCLETDGNIAKRGILIRHLILPGRVANSFRVLNLIKEHIPLGTTLSIMSQYTPTPAVKDHPSLGRRVSSEEYEAVVNRALDMGFDNIFTQVVDEQILSPDFEREEPFDFSARTTLV